MMSRQKMAVARPRCSCVVSGVQQEVFESCFPTPAGVGLMFHTGLANFKVCYTNCKPLRRVTIERTRPVRQ